MAIHLYPCKQCGERNALGVEQGPNGDHITCFSCRNTSDDKPTWDDAAHDWNDKNTN